MADDAESPPPARGPQYNSFRSTVSNNWRLKDDTPRTEQPQLQRGPQSRRDQHDTDSYGSPRGGGGGGYNNPSRQHREAGEVPTEVTTPKLYVGNLLYTASSADIENFFVSNGFSPVDISMSIDPATGRNPSYCFVDLESVDEAKRAMEQLNGMDVLGRGVRLNPGVARKEAGGFGTPRRAAGWRDGNDQQGYRPASDRYASNNASPQQWSRNTQSSVEQSKRVYVGGLPNLDQATLEAEIPQLFAPIQVSSVSKLIAPHASKANEVGDHHYLFVDLSRSEDAETIIDRLNESVSPWSEDGQGKLRVNRAKEGGNRRTGQSYGQGSRDGQGEREFGRTAWRG